jgi:hypothetical protein
LLFFIRASQPRSIKCTASRARLERLATDRSGGGELVDGVGKSLRPFIRANVVDEHLADLDDETTQLGLSIGLDVDHRPPPEP